MILRSLLLIATALSVTACQPRPPAEAITYQYMTQVLAEIKAEVGDYQSAVSSGNYARTQEGATCGSGGDLKLLISKVKVELTATHDDTASGNANATLPIPAGGGGTLGPIASLSREAKDTQTMTFYEVPIAISTDRSGKNTINVYGKPRGDGEHGALYRSLMDFQKALVASRSIPPCFTSPTGGDSSNTFSAAFTATVKTTGGIALKLVVINGGFSTEFDRTTGNTITLTFITSPSNVVFLQNI